MNISDQAKKVGYIISQIGQLKSKDSFQRPRDLNDEIDFLEIEFTTITNIHNKHSLQLNQTFDRIESYLGYDYQSTNKMIESILEKVQHTTFERLVQEKDRLIDSKTQLKLLIQKRAVTIEGMVNEQMREQINLSGRVNAVLSRQVGDMRMKVRREGMDEASLAKIKNKMKQKQSCLAACLKQVENKNSQIRKHARTQLTEVMKVFDQIEAGRKDRQEKQEQIITMVEHLCTQDRTNEETVINSQ